MSKAKQYLTRKELVAHIKQQHGVPVSRSALEKLRVRPDRYYGRAGLYSPKTAAKIAQSLISDHPSNLGLNQPVTEPNNEAST
jgi:hypothetical protein